MRERHGPPPADRTVLAHDMARNMWAFCTPHADGFALTILGSGKWRASEGWEEDLAWYDLPDERPTGSAPPVEGWVLAEDRDGPQAFPPKDFQPHRRRVMEAYIHAPTRMLGISGVASTWQAPVEVARDLIRRFDARTLGARSALVAALQAAKVAAVAAGGHEGLLRALDHVLISPLEPGRYRSPDGVEGTLHGFDAFANRHTFQPDGWEPGAPGPNASNGLVYVGKGAAGWVRIDAEAASES